MPKGAEDRRRRAAAMAVSIAAHLALPLVWLAAQRDAPPDGMAAMPDPVIVSMIQPPPAPPGPPLGDEPPAAAPPAPPAPHPSPPAIRLHAAAPSPTVAPLVAPPAEAPAPVQLVTLGDAELAGARTAGTGTGAGDGSGSGAGGGGGRQSCDMVRRLQAALRRDPEVRQAIARANVETGRAVLVWNGDWLRSPGQEGKGLAGVRQAIVMEVAFAPETCRADPVQGLVVLSLGEHAGAGRVVLGGGAWRWTDLLAARRRG